MLRVGPCAEILWVLLACAECEFVSKILVSPRIAPCSCTSSWSWRPFVASAGEHAARFLKVSKRIHRRDPSSQLSKISFFCTGTWLLHWHQLHATCKFRTGGFLCGWPCTGKANAKQQPFSGKLASTSWICSSLARLMVGQGPPITWWLHSL